MDHSEDGPDHPAGDRDFGQLEGDGGGERREVQQNFPIRTGETAYLFLQHFIRKLRAGGRAAVVIKNTFLTRKAGSKT